MSPSQHVYLYAPLLHIVQVRSFHPSSNHGTMKLIISIQNHTYHMFSLIINPLVFLQIFHFKSTHSSHQKSPCVMTSTQPITQIKLLSFFHTPTNFTHSKCWHPFYISAMTMMPTHFFTSCGWVFYHAQHITNLVHSFRVFIQSFKRFLCSCQNKNLASRPTSNISLLSWVVVMQFIIFPTIHPMADASHTMIFTM